MLTTLVYLSGIVSLGAARRLKSNLGPVVDLGYAAYAGNTTSPTGLENGPVAFFGNIRYAEPPLGELRFRAPVQLDEGTLTSQVLDARDWGPPCVQLPAVVGIGTEDCLTLNVWKPTNASSGDALPVVAYIHGGGFFAGSPQGFPLYDWVAQHPGGIVGVSIAYRMSLLGFLGGPVVAADGDLVTGLLDQRAGLEWIQRHISKFGGDPNQVSIYGESAGGASVVMQVAAYGGSKPVPFKRATAQSIGFGPTSTANQTAALFSAFFPVEPRFPLNDGSDSAAEIIGCPDSGSDAMPCLRNASLGAIVSAINRVKNGEFSPVIDGDFLPDLPSRLIAAGKINNVDFIGGHCTGDGNTFVGGSPDDFHTDDDIRRIVFARMPGVSNATIDKALTLYPAPNATGSPFATQYDRASAMAGDVVFTCMDWLLAERLTANGVKNVFSYSWNAPDTVLFNQFPFRGAAHTSDLYYLFDGTNRVGNAGNTFTPFNTSEAVLSREAVAYWTSFAAAGDPSTDKEAISPAWDSFATPNAASRRQLTVNRGNDTVTDSMMGNMTETEIQRCQFWMSADVVAETRV